MTKEEILNIEVLDRFYVDEAIFKRFLFGGGKWFKAYEPGKFYVVLEIKVTKVGFHIRTNSEVGANGIFLIKGDDITPVTKHFNFVKKKDYKEIESVQFFDSI